MQVITDWADDKPKNTLNVIPKPFLLFPTIFCLLYCFKHKVRVVVKF